MVSAVELDAAKHKPSALATTKKTAEAVKQPAVKAPPHVSFDTGGEEPLPTKEDILKLESHEDLPQDCLSGIPRNVAEVALKSYTGIEDGYGRCHDPRAACTTITDINCNGCFENGYINGRADLTLPEGTRYRGVLNANRLTGLAVVEYPDEVVYVGEVLNGQHHGHGTLQWADGAVAYEGDFAEGRRHGSGCLSFGSNKEQQYVGAWRADQKHGWGKLQYASGSVYEGDWAHDKKHGFGIMYWTDRMQRYRGYWWEGVQSGVGEHTWYDGFRPTLPSHAVVLQCNRYVGMIRAGRRHGEGCMQYANGARYEGQWQDDVKHGDGIYVFEDGSFWEGSWSGDQPVKSPDGPAFRAESYMPKLYIDDLLANAPNREFTVKGISNVLMSNNTELRSLYDVYAARDIPWFHSGAYAKACDQRPCFGILSMHVWQMLHDAALMTPDFSLARVDECLIRACAPPAAIADRRKRVLRGDHAAGVWTFDVPPHSPFRELTYSQFCEALVRMADSRFYDVPNLERRLHRLITHHLLKLLSARPHVPVQSFLGSAEFVQYYQTIDPIMKIVYAAVAQRVQRTDPDSDVPRCKLYKRTTPAPKAAAILPRHSEGMLVEAEHAEAGKLAAAWPRDTRSHPLDIVPKDESEWHTLTLAQVVLVLSNCGFVAITAESRGKHPGTALEAMLKAVFPSAVVPSSEHATESSDRGAWAAELARLFGVSEDPSQSPSASQAGLRLTYYEFVLACVGVSQALSKGESPLAKFKALVDGPRGLLAEGLRATHSTLPPELASAFAYMLQPVGANKTGKSTAGSRRSRRGADSASLISDRSMLDAPSIDVT